MHLSKQDEVDLIDLLPLALFPIAAGVVFEVFTFSLDVFGGWSPSEVLFSAAGTDWTWGFIIAMLALVSIVATNEIDGSEYEDWEYFAIIFAFATVPLYKFVPSFQNLVNHHDAVVFTVFILTAIAAAWVAYTE